MATKGLGARDAVSHYRVMRQIASPYGKFALLEVVIDTGRTHQIRVHLSSIGHPIVGDALYGARSAPGFEVTRDGRPVGPDSRGEGPGPVSGQRLGDVLAPIALHASRVAFTHPGSGARLE